MCSFCATCFFIVSIKCRYDMVVIYLHLHVMILFLQQNLVSFSSTTKLCVVHSNRGSLRVIASRIRNIYFSNPCVILLPSKQSSQMGLLTVLKRLGLEVVHYDTFVLEQKHPISNCHLEYISLQHGRRNYDGRIFLGQLSRRVQHTKLEEIGCKSSFRNEIFMMAYFELEHLV